MIHGVACPGRDTWDRYLLGDQLANRQELDRHLTICSLCRLLLAERRSYFTDLSDVVRASKRPTVIEFRQVGLGEEVYLGGALLAAKGRAEESAPETATLCSSGQEMMLRILRDSHSREVWMYLIADDPSLYAQAIVKPFGQEHEYVTDAQGRVNLGVIAWPESDSLKAEVHLPKAVFDLALMKSLQKGEAPAILTTSQGDEIRVIVSGEERQRCLNIELVRLTDFSREIPVRVAIRQGGDGLLSVRTLADDRASFGNVDTPDRLEIFLFQ